MSPRLESALLASALIRKVAQDGGIGTVIATGDPTAGALLILITERGHAVGLRERGFTPKGEQGWIATGPAAFAEPEVLEAYIARRRKSDPDLWVLELDGVSLSEVDMLLEAA